MLSLRKLIAGGCWRTPLSLWRPSSTSFARPGWPLVRAYSSSVPPTVRALSESFLDGSSAVYVEEMYQAWKADSSSVHKSWDAFFRNAEAGIAPGGAYMSPPTLGSVGSAAPSPAGSVGSMVLIITYPDSSKFN
jgi:hypothetical protein